MDARKLDDYHYLQLDEKIWKNPYPFYKALREQAPIYREPDYGVYIVSRYDDVVEADRQAEAFSHIDIGMAPYRELPADLDALPQWRDSRAFVDRLMLNDPPDHTRHRRVLNRLFNAKRIARIEPRIRELANELIDEFIDDGEVEFVQNYSTILPKAVMGELIGVPRADSEMLQKAVRRPGSRVRRESENPKEDFHRSMELRRVYEDNVALDKVVSDYFSKALLERRENPRGDVMSDFANARFSDGEEVPLNTLVGMVELIYRTGSIADDIIELLNSIMLMMMSRREIEPELRADPTLIEPFIEEALRYDTSLQGVFRVALRDTSVGGTAIGKGDIVLLLYASANRDEAHFGRNEAFELRRYCNAATRRHLSFGTGAHSCAGAPLARLQAKITTQEILRRLRNIRFPESAESIPYAASVLTRNAVRLDVAFGKNEV